MRERDFPVNLATSLFGTARGDIRDQIETRHGKRCSAMRSPARGILSVGLLAALLIGTAGEGAAAQQPSQGQIAAVRQSCRSDYMTHCANVPAGGAAALACLHRNVSSLSAACQQAVNAIPPTRAKIRPASPSEPRPAREAAGPPAEQPTGTVADIPAPVVPAAPTVAIGEEPALDRVQTRRLRQFCGSDYRVHCSGIRPGGSAAIACLRRNAPTLSGACQRTLEAVAGATATIAPPREAPPLLASRGEELFVLRIACAPDYRRFCRGLLPGAGRIAACLHYYDAELSPSCQQALATLREGR